MIDNASHVNSDEQLSDNGSIVMDSMDWWPGISDLDRLNILNHPTEEKSGY